MLPMIFIDSSFTDSVSFVVMWEMGIKVIKWYSFESRKNEKIN